MAGMGHWRGGSYQAYQICVSLSSVYPSGRRSLSSEGNTDRYEAGIQTFDTANVSTQQLDWLVI